MAKTPEETRQATALAGIALTTLVGRAGGILEIQISEYDQVVERYGGKGKATMFVELLEGGGPKRVRVTVVSKEPKQGDLMA